MKCDRCNSEATVHDVLIRNGQRVERHLCERCAAAEGVAPPVGGTPESVAALLSKFVSIKSGATTGQRDPSPTCGTCGLTFAQFRHDGLMGCPDCYTAFEAPLGPLLERAHEGGVHHVGKVPVRLRGGLRSAARGDPPAAPATDPRPDIAEDRSRRLAALRRRLAEAVSHERYEEAARLRDELRALECGGSTGAGGPSEAPPDAPPSERTP
jgi:protein arginine kinase activator